MTIALGLIADDGVVIAADRQETLGEQKTDQRKIESLWAMPVGSLLVSGAGNGPYLDSMTQRLYRCFGVDGLEWDEADDMTEKFRQTHAAFYSEAVLPFSGYQPYERPDYELLFGCSVGNSAHFLWYSHKLALNRVQGYRAVGIGQATAEAMLKKFYVTRLPLKVAISLAAYVVYQVKNSVEGCGFETDVMFTQIGTPPCRVTPETIQGMDKSFAEYRLIERDDLYNCIGGGVIPKNRDVKGWNKLRRDLKKPFDTFCEEFDKIYYRKPTPSASQTPEPEP
jgi:hypothetical protein